MPIEKLAVEDSLKHKVGYHLLLSEDELNDLSLFIEYLCANEVDYKYKGSKKKPKKICNCPDDTYDDDENENQNLSPDQREYMSTRKIRRKLSSLYLTEMRTCKVCQIKTSYLKKYSLAEAQRRIIGCPTYNPLLEKYTVDDIKKKKKIQDQELDELITYIKQKKEALEKYLHDPDKFESNKQTYYWINQNLLP